MQQVRIPAVYMRGGTSKGLFFRAGDLPDDPELRDRILLRVTGSPDPYGQQIDGMGGGISSSSKGVLIRRSAHPGYDVEYSFGQVAIDKPIIDCLATAETSPRQLACSPSRRVSCVPRQEMWQSSA
jgi:2-methylaconitate isomerase